MIYTLEISPEQLSVIVQALRERAQEPGGPEREELAHLVQAAPREEDGLAAGAHLMRAWYYERVEDLARGVLASILAGEVSDLSDYLHETVDGTDLVIYTYKASAVLFASDNEDAGEQEMGEVSTVEGRAYWALLADVRERLEQMVSYGPPEGIDLPEGFDLYDSDTWTMPEDEETTEADAVTPAGDEKGGAS